ncbi:hypothetical protein TI04_03985 [Achromatium sp. WMS2]|nr:hypothetical protein TI04_03985 [Achromatium sp. WMS2]
MLGPLWPRISNAIAVKNSIEVCVVETDTIPEVQKSVPPERHRSTTAKTQRDLYALTGKQIPTKNSHAVLVAIEEAFKMAQPSGSVCIILEEKGINTFIDLQGALVHPSEPEILLKPNETLLSFNSKLPRGGRCPTCRGIGEIEAVLINNLLDDLSKPLAYGGLALPYDEKSKKYKYFPTLVEELAGFLVSRGHSQFVTWQDIDSQEWQSILNGNDQIFQPISEDGRPRGKKKPFEGIVKRIEKSLSSDSTAAKVLRIFRDQGLCPDCKGSRLSYPARRVFIGETPLEVIYKFSLTELLHWLGDIGNNIPNSHLAHFQELKECISSCCSLGLGHLPLIRGVPSISGGEGQRLRIARELVSHVTPSVYVLDEPTRGLHATDARHILRILRGLLLENTSIIVVDHNPEVINGVDYLVELGPTAGANGGTIVYKGPPLSVEKKDHTYNFSNLSANSFQGWISLEGITFRNVNQQSVDIPLGSITCFSGVSGSGKTTIVRDVLFHALHNYLENNQSFGNTYQRIAIKGQKFSGKVLHLSQMAPADNPRSLVLTYLGLGDVFRDWFSQKSQSEKFGLGSSNFSPNTIEGKCPTCAGLGYISLDGIRWALPCGACNGSGIRPLALVPLVENQNFAQWMEIPVDQLSVNSILPLKIQKTCQLLSELGLGYVSLSRRIPTLSGGEWQRLRMALSLLDFENLRGNKSTKHLIFLLDEPAAGLHIADQMKLLGALRRIVSEKNHTVILVEHSLFMIERGDWIVEVGPGSAENGGCIIFQGSPKDLIGSGPVNSHTRQAILGNFQTISTISPSTYPSSIKLISPTSHSKFNTSIEEDEDSIKATSPSLEQPTYVIDAEETSGQNHDLLALIGAAVPLYQLFARYSVTDNGLPIQDQEQLIRDAYSLAEKLSTPFIGWFPATWLGSMESLTWHDIKKSIETQLALGAWGWFYEKKVIHKPPPPKGNPFEISNVRILVDPSISTELSIRQALSFGEGWLSVINSQSGEIYNFSLRTLSDRPLQIGVKQQVSQIFDRNSDFAPCILCGGKGLMQSVDEKYIIANYQRKITEPDFFTPFVNELLKSSFRKDMLPALTRLANSGLIDLTVPYTQLDSEGLKALWFGFPRKAFLAQGKDPAIKGNWYRWRGLFTYVQTNIWKTSDRSWSKTVNESFKNCSCPECLGSGLGWEARSRQIKGTTLQEILTNLTISELYKWLTTIRIHVGSSDSQFDKLKRTLHLANTTELKDVLCGSRLGTLSPEQRIMARILACRENELLGASVEIRTPIEPMARRIQHFINSFYENSQMSWNVVTDNLKQE